MAAVGFKHLEPGRIRLCATVQGHGRSRSEVRITFQNCCAGASDSDEYCRNGVTLVGAEVLRISIYFLIAFLVWGSGCLLVSKKK